MDVLYRVLCDAVVVIHFAFVLFVAGGALLVLHWRRLAWGHLAALAWGVAIELTGWVCPLTPLEKWLRSQGGEAGYEGGFIDHYIGAILYPEGLTGEMQVVLAALALGINAVLYAWIVTRWRRERG
ncbi:MAG: DUF2784 domain-containing protein [Planctomycetota bacterium]